MNPTTPVTTPVVRHHAPAVSTWHQVLHYLTHTLLPHSANPIANFMWTTLTLLTVIATIGMLGKLLRREKGLIP